MARIEPLPPANWTPEVNAALIAIRPEVHRHPFPARDPSRPKALNLLGVLARYPELTAVYQAFTGQVLFNTSLTARQRELLVLRVAARRHCAYEWAQHAFMAGEADISEGELRSIRDGSSATWSPLEAALLDAADELVDDARISDATWEKLSAALDTRQLMEVVFTVGAYEILAMALRSFDVGMDADLLAPGILQLDDAREEQTRS